MYPEADLDSDQARQHLAGAKRRLAAELFACVEIDDLTEPETIELLRLLRGVGHRRVLRIVPAPKKWGIERASEN